MFELILLVQLCLEYILIAFFFLDFFENNYIFYCNYIGIAHIILPNLHVILIFICLIIENFKKVLIRRLAIGSIVVYCTSII